MTDLRIGSLFSGYGGLDQGVQAVLGGSTAWVSDIDKGACKILAHRYPDVPNLGDITTVDWSAVEPVDVLTGGFPCQDVSAAGKRAGIRPGTRSGLWAQFAYAISQLRPKLVVIENVRGLLSARAHSDVEPCAWCVGDDTDGALRALGAVLGDLAGLGYDASWYGLRAADVGAPHGRFRVFVVAYPQGDPGRLEHGATRDSTGGHRWAGNAGREGQGSTGEADRTVALLPSPRTSDTNGAGRHGDGGLDLRTAVSLLPTPACNDMGEGKTVEAWDEWTAKMKAAHGNGNGHGASLAIEAQRLLPTPTAMDYTASGGNPDTTGTHGTTLTDATVRQPDRWGQYAAAIHRWEAVLGRPAPSPTELGPKGTPRLAAAFSEFMMGLPAGWITDVPGITRNEALKAAGNGVVPQQAEAALRHLLAVSEVAA